jgi:hypothetical protein
MNARHYATQTTTATLATVFGQVVNAKKEVGELVLPWRIFSFGIHPFIIIIYEMIMISY